MNESDIIEIVDILNLAIKLSDWDSVEEAIAYLKEYLPDTEQEN
jgi:hypothetical protein